MDISQKFSKYFSLGSHIHVAPSNRPSHHPSIAAQALLYIKVCFPASLCIASNKKSSEQQSICGIIVFESSVLVQAG